MKIVELKTVDGKIRYYLADGTGAPMQPVLNYLKFKDNAGYARNCPHKNEFHKGPSAAPHAKRS